MKLTKTQLKEMIQKVLEEELKQNTVLLEKTASPRKKEQIMRLAKLCVRAFKQNPDLWIDAERNESIFDFPEYGGLPKRLAGSLSSDAVDVIQAYTYDVAFGSDKMTVGGLYRRLIEYSNGGYAIP